MGSAKLVTHAGRGVMVDVGRGVRVGVAVNVEMGIVVFCAVELGVDGREVISEVAGEFEHA
jgi:hypothetical protein